MKVLLTGGSGQIGSALQRHVPASWTVTAPPRDQLDLSSDASICSFVQDFRPDWVINAAAYTDVEKAETEQALAERINGEAPGILSREAEKVGGRLLQISTDYVFDGQSAVPYPTDARRNPLSTYGRTKLAGENSLRKTDMIVRTGWVYASAGQNFLNAILRKLLDGAPLKVVSDQFGSPTWSESIATALIELIEVGPSGIFHFSDRGRASWYDFAVEISEVCSAFGILHSAPEIIPIKSCEIEQRAERPANSVLDCEPTYRQLSTSPRAWQDNLRRVLADYRATNRYG